MKKLLYQHIENVGKIKAQDMYYSYEYRFDYDRKLNSLFVNKTENTLSGFYGDNIEGITLLIGENGAGKTTIMELLALPDETYKKRFTAPFFKDMDWFAVYEIENDCFAIEGTGEFFGPGVEGNVRQYRYGTVDKQGKFYDIPSAKSTRADSKDVLVYRPTEIGIKSIYSDRFKETGDNGNKRIFVDASAEKLCVFLLHDYEKYSGSHRLDQHKLTIIQDGPDIDVSLESQYSNKKLFMLGLWESSMDRIENYCKDVKKFDVHKSMWAYEKKGFEIEPSNTISEEFIKSLFDERHDNGAEMLRKKHIPYEYFDYYMEQIQDEELKKLYIEYAKNYKFDDTKCHDKEKDALIREVADYYAQRENSFQEIKEVFFVAKNCIRMAICLENEKYFHSLQFSHSYSFSAYLYDDDAKKTPVLRTEFTSMSTGEKAFIGMFAGMFTNTDDLDNDSMGIICLDEPDNFLHPEWSRIFLNILVESLNRCKGKYQVIITSHSPLMTSDLLKKDIWCLNGEGKIEQSKSGWMSNIHNVYQDSFYLRSTFGELGQKRLKEKVIDRLNKEANSTELVEQVSEIIDEVCDPILQKALDMQVEHKKSGE